MPDLYDGSVGNSAAGIEPFIAGAQYANDWDRSIAEHNALLANNENAVSEAPPQPIVPQPCEPEIEKQDQRADIDQSTPLLSSGMSLKNCIKLRNEANQPIGPPVTEPTSAPSNSEPELPPTQAVPTPEMPPTIPAVSPVEPTVTVPLAKLQQLVELCAQVLRESKEKGRLEPDLERDAGAVRNRAADEIQAQASSENFNSIPWPDEGLPELDSSHKEIIEEIWRNVIHRTMPNIREGLGPKRPEVEDLAYDNDVYELFLKRDPPGPPAKLLDSLEPWEAERAVRFAKAISYTNQYGRSYGKTKDRKALRRVLLLFISKIVPEHFMYEGPFKLAGTPSLGKILEDCYRTRILEQPRPSEVEEYYQHALLVVDVLSTSNVILKFDAARLEGPFRAFWSQRPINNILEDGNSLGGVFGIQVHSLLQILHATLSKPSSIPSADGITFTVSDLNIKSLAEIGGLSLRWTDVLEDHLLLNIVDRSLSIAWFPSHPGLRSRSLMGDWQRVQVMNLPWTFMGGRRDKGEVEDEQLARELSSSWAFLFATSPRVSKRELDYDRIGRPEWHSLPHVAQYIEEHPNFYKLQRQLHINTQSSLYLEVQADAFKRSSLSYKQFPLFENRLRQLRHYMDSQKPRGLGQLWKDNRDSLNYYTFWGVIVFGALSVFLAVFSLAVSVAQTIASFRSLDLSTSSSSSPPSSSS